MNKRNYIISAILLAFIAITITIGSVQKIWTDEGYSVLTTSQNLKEVPRIALQFELQPPVYFVLLKIWRLIFDSVLWMRLLSIVITCFSILLFERLARIFTDKYVLIYTALFAVNPAVVWSSLEIRSYALMLLMAIVLMYYFYKFYLINPCTTYKYRLVYSILSVIAVWVNYYLVLLLISNFLVLLLNKNRKTSVNYLIDMVIPACSTLIFIPFFSHQYNSYTKGIERITNLKGVLMFIYHRYEEYLFNPKLFIVFLRYALRLFFYVLIALQIWKFWKETFTQNRNIRFLFYHLAVITGVLLIMVPFVNVNLIKYRHTLFVFPLLMLAFFLLLSNLKKIYSLLLFSLIGLMYLLNTGTIYYYSLLESGVVESAKYLEKNEQNDQDIIYYRNELGLIFDYYYDGKNQTFAIPYKIRVDKPYNHNLWNIKSTENVKAYFDTVDLTKHVWLLTDTYFETIFGTNYNYDTLDMYINQNFNTDFDTVFRDGTRLRFISRLSPLINVDSTIVQD